MLNAILGTKKDMNQVFVKGQRVPVTNINAGPCTVTQIISYDGFWGIQLGLGEKKVKNLSKPLKGHLKAAKSAAAFLREVRVLEEPDLKVGDKIMVDQVFSKGDKVTVTGTSKGKGFAGVMKRWGFAGGPRTHGQSDRQRAPGSIGQGTTPGRVRKGKKMAGRMGSDTIEVKNLTVISVDKEKNSLQVSGPVPGTRNGFLVIKKLKKKDKNGKS